MAAFVSHASSLGIHFAIDQASNQTKLQWARMWNMLGMYTGTYMTHQQIGQMYNVTGEYVRQTIKRSVEKLYDASPEELQQVYPFESFNLEKPHSERNRRTIAESRGSKTYRAIDALQAGMDAKQVRRELELTAAQMQEVRAQARRLGMDVPLEIQRWQPTMQRLQDPELSQNEIQRLLDTINRTALNKHKEMFSSIDSTARKAGLMIKRTSNNLNFLANVLRESGVPTGYLEYTVEPEKKTFRYYFILRSHSDLAHAALASDERLSRYSRDRRVRILGKQSEATPISTEMLGYKKAKYLPVTKIFQELGRNGHRLPRGLTFESLLGKDCPVSVYKYINIYRVAAQDHDALKTYLSERLRNLGII